MTPEPSSHIEPSFHSTDEVDQKLRDVERNVEAAPGAGSPAIKPNTGLGEDGKPEHPAATAASASIPNPR